MLNAISRAENVPQRIEQEKASVRFHQSRTLHQGEVVE